MKFEIRDLDQKFKIQKLKFTKKIMNIKICIIATKIALIKDHSCMLLPTNAFCIISNLMIELTWMNHFTQHRK